MRWKIAVQLLPETPTALHLSILSPAKTASSSSDSEDAFTVCAQWS